MKSKLNLCFYFSLPQFVNIIKRTLHVGLKIWILFSRVKNNILLARCARKILFSPLENKIHIFAPLCNILYIRVICCYAEQNNDAIYFDYDLTFIKVFIFILKLSNALFTSSRMTRRWRTGRSLEKKTVTYQTRIVFKQDYSRERGRNN
jgi:hypothetical protein